MLAGQSDRQIAARCKVRPKLVGHFERLHFAVRHALKARDYLVKHALGRDIFVDQGFGDKEVAEFWGWCAIHGGVAVVDFMVERLRDVVAPGNEPTMMAYFDSAFHWPCRASSLAMLCPTTSRWPPYGTHAG